MLQKMSLVAIAKNLPAQRDPSLRYASFRMTINVSTLQLINYSTIQQINDSTIKQLKRLNDPEEVI